MNCIKCKKNAIIEMHHGFYCENCFVKYFEKKIYDTIVKYKLIKKGEKIGVAVSGGKDSLTAFISCEKIYEQT
jgi:hypothetical protein